MSLPTAPRSSPASDGSRRRYSAWQVLQAAARGHADWAPAWRDAEPKPRYDIVIVGGGGHGLATAYYLAKNHGITNVAVLERAWIGGGNTGRNTTVVRSNYLYPESARLYDFSVKLYEGLARELNFNIMFSQRGVVELAHHKHQMDQYARLANAMHASGVKLELLDRAQVHALAPRLNFDADARFPIVGGYVQRRGGTARHDAVAWGYARAASAMGVDIVQNCTVTGFETRVSATGVRISGVHTSRGAIHADQVALVVAGSSGELARLAGFRLPITSYALQAMVSEPVKPVLDTCVGTPAVGCYWSQSDKGELVIGGGLDHFPSYAQRGSFEVAQHILAATAEFLPSLGRLRLLRQWAGVVDVVPDSSPILGASPVPGLLLNCGWGTGGFKAIPAGGWTLAHRLATGQDHALAEPFGLARFTSGRLVDEMAAAGIAH